MTIFDSRLLLSVENQMRIIELARDKMMLI